MLQLDGRVATLQILQTIDVAARLMMCAGGRLRREFLAEITRPLIRWTTAVLFSVLVDHALHIIQV